MITPQWVKMTTLLKKNIYKENTTTTIEPVVLFEQCTYTTGNDINNGEQTLFLCITGENFFNEKMAFIFAFCDVLNTFLMVFILETKKRNTSQI
jgi:hypothetical protein